MTISCKAWNSPAEYPSWVARCDMKGSDGTMLIPILRNNVQGQKHHGRWGNVEHQIPSIKVLFWTNAKSHTHSDVILLSLDRKTQLVNQRKQNSYRRAYIYIYIYLLTQSWTGTKVIRKKHIPNPQVSAPVPRPVVNGMERMCQRHGSDQTPTYDRVFLKIWPSKSKVKVIAQGHQFWEDTPTAFSLLGLRHDHSD